MPLQEKLIVPVVSTAEPAVASKLPNATFVMDRLQLSAIAGGLKGPMQQRAAVNQINNWKARTSLGRYIFLYG